MQSNALVMFSDTIFLIVFDEVLPESSSLLIHQFGLGFVHAYDTSYEAKV